MTPDLEHCPFDAMPALLEQGTGDHHRGLFNLGCSNSECVAFRIFYDEQTEDLDECVALWNGRPHPGTPAPVAWLCGLSGSGKSTIAELVAGALAADCQILDGDQIRTTICRGLAFSHADRLENLRRVAWLAGFLSQHGVTVIVAAITPYAEAITQARAIIGAPLFMVYCDASLAACEARDVKGLYAKARSGQLVGFTGIQDAFEPPIDPELVCHTATETPGQSAAKVRALLRAAQ